MQAAIKPLMFRLIRLRNLMLAHSKEEGLGSNYSNNTFNKNQNFYQIWNLKRTVLNPFRNVRFEHVGSRFQNARCETPKGKRLATKMIGFIYRHSKQN